MPTIHLRNVPQDVYEGLVLRAATGGRSLNAEVLEILTAEATRESRHAGLMARLEALAKRIDLPADAPRPEDLIREDRDRR